MKLAWICLATVASGCGIQLRDPCADVAGTCLALHVDPSAEVGEVDEIMVSSAPPSAPPRSTVVADGSRVSLPLGIALIFDAAPEPGLSVRVEARWRGAPFISDELPVALIAGQHATIHATLHSGDAQVGGNGDGDAGGGSGNDAALPDLASGPDLCMPLSACPATVGCGTIDDGCGGHVQCAGTCQLSALTPALANSGATLMLEGTFGAKATVEFPGGIAQPASVLGAHRAAVVVPAGATAGDLTVTTGMTSLGPVPFHRAPFTLDLGPFRGTYDQAAGGHAMPGVARVSGASVTVGRYVYFIGGAANRTTSDPPVARATVNPDGTIDSVTSLPAVTLAVVRRGHGAVVLGSSIYVIGGSRSSDGAVLDSVERATIAADGSLSTFAVVPGVTLHSARSGHAVEIIGDHLYVIGGFNGGPLADVESAAIGPDGTLSSFVPVAGVALTTARRLHTTVVRGDRLYVVGGWSDHRLASVESAAISPDGTLGPFASVDGVALATARSGHRSFVVGDAVYVVAGDDDSGHHLTSIERASFVGDALSTFAPVGFSLTTERSEPVLFVAGSYVYVTGGYSNSGYVSLSERASLDGSGGLGRFAVVPEVALATPRAFHTGVAAGRYIYVIGGRAAGAGGAALAEIEAATVQPDGSLSTFAPLSGIQLATGRLAHAVFVGGGVVYVLGGLDATGATINSVESAALNADGSFAATFAPVSGTTLGTGRYGATSVAWVNAAAFVLGGANGPNGVSTIENAYLPQGFQNVTATLPSGSSYHSSVLLGSTVYTLGGDSSAAAYLDAVYGATFDASWSLSSFTLSPSALLTGRYGHATVVLGSALYVVGGQNNQGPLASIERAPVAVDGTLGAFAAEAAALNERRSSFSAVAVGDYVYVIGGVGASGVALGSVERAALE